MRSDSSTPPGSRRSSTSTPRAASAGARRSASVVLPAPSRPSIVMSRPRMVVAFQRRWPGPNAIPTPARGSAPPPPPRARAGPGPARPPDGRPSHAYLFHGPAGAGKREAARAFAAELLAEGAADPANAKRRAIEGVHPDLTWVPPSGAAEMLVGDIEEPVIGAASRTPFEAR